MTRSNGLQEAKQRREMLCSYHQMEVIETIEYKPDYADLS